MSKKAIAIKVPARPATPDDWVGRAQEDAPKPAKKEPTKRLTVDVPEKLHRDLKLACVQRGKMMSDYVRDLLKEAIADA